MVTEHTADEFVQLLSDAAAEIANLDGPANEVCRRLRELQRQLKPLKLSVGELAKRIDVSPRDVLDAAMAVGVREFRHQSQHFQTPSQVHDYLSMAFHFDPVPELEFDLTPDQAARLAAEMDVELDIPKSCEATLPVGQSEFEKLLMDAAVEIAMLDGTDNNIFRRLLAELQHQPSHAETVAHDFFLSRNGVSKPPRKFSPSESAAPTRKTDEKKQSG